MDFLNFFRDIRGELSQYPWLEMLVSLTILILFAAIANFIAKRIIVRGVRHLVTKLKSPNQSIFAQHSVIKKFANIVPAVVIMNGIATVPHLSPKFIAFVEMAAQAFIFLTLALTVSELLNIFNLIYQRNPKSRNKPIKGYLQLVKLILFVVCGLMILGTFLKKDVFTLLAGFGAMAAVLMLVFQNTILSLVASVQIASYDMVRIGDWIEMPSLNADGDVIDISLHTVTVQNFDKTYTTIPTNKLVTDTFKNWRGMQESGGRRIKRSLNIDMNSIRLVDDAFREQIDDAIPLHDYIRVANLPNPVTNLGLFRRYAEGYLKQHEKINRDLTLMVRELQPINHGLPIEFYCFSEDKRWISYEHLQAEIMDHLLAVLPIFGLRPYQSVTGQLSTSEAQTGLKPSIKVANPPREKA